MNIKNHDGTANFVPGTVLDIHHISQAQLALLGLEEIAFMKPVVTENGPAFAIHAADGTPMALATSQDLAAAAIIQNDMTPYSVQ